MQLTPWQRLRTRIFLLAMGLKRRMTLGVRVVLVEKNKVFLIRHTYLPGWHFPGGGVEPGETAMQSAIRETLEETGYCPQDGMALFGLYHNVSPASNRDHVALYICSGFLQETASRTNFEISGFGWFSIDALPEDITPGTARRIEEIFRGAPQAAVW